MRTRVTVAFVLIALGLAAFLITPVKGLISTKAPDSRLGINLPDLLHSGPIFIDAMKQAAPWTARGPLHEDPAGNVISLKRGQVAETTIYRNAQYPAGDYTLLYDGTGIFDISSQSGSVSERSPGRIVMRITPNRAGIHIRLASVYSPDYPRNIRLMLPGYANRPPDRPFYPPFLRALENYAAIRFANWAHGNSYAVSTVWPSRTKTQDFTQAAPPGVAIEYTIALANATADDPWFTIPVGATDYWVENFTALLAQQLDPRLHPIIEYGDAVWQKGTPAYRYAIMAARNTGLNSDPLAWYSKRSVRIFALVQQGLGSRSFTRVLAGPMPDAANAEIDRAILTNANASASADAFAVPGRAQGLKQAQDVARNAHLRLLAYDDGLTATVRDSLLEAWHAAGGGLFVLQQPFNANDYSLSSGAAAYLARHPSPPHLRPSDAPLVQSSDEDPIAHAARPEKD